MADILGTCNICPPPAGLFDLPVAPIPFDPSSVMPHVAPTPERDSFVLCDPATGSRVVVVTTYNTTTGVPSTVGYNLDGTPYGGVLTALVAC